jgi:hypothetical protein
MCTYNIIMHRHPWEAIDKLTLYVVNKVPPTSRRSLALPSSIYPAGLYHTWGFQKSSSQIKPNMWYMINPGQPITHMPLMNAGKELINTCAATNHFALSFATLWPSTNHFAFSPCCGLRLIGYSFWLYLLRQNHVAAEFGHCHRYK